MTWLTLIGVGFLVVTATVVVLARASTAQWEQDKRAHVAARHDGSAPRKPLAGSARRLSGARIRTRVAALRSTASRFPPVAFLARSLPEALHAGASRARHIRRSVHAVRFPLRQADLPRFGSAEGRSPALPDDGDGMVPADAVSSGGVPSAAVPRSDGVPRARRPGFRRTVHLPRRGARAFLHRHEDTQGPRTLPAEESDGGDAHRRSQHR
jgi:hypothetical protein